MSYSHFGLGFVRAWESVLSVLDFLNHYSKWVYKFYNYLTQMFILIRGLFSLKTILIVYSCGKTLRLNVTFGQNNVCLYSLLS